MDLEKSIYRYLQRWSPKVRETIDILFTAYEIGKGFEVSIAMSCPDDSSYVCLGEHPLKEGGIWGSVFHELIKGFPLGVNSALASLRHYDSYGRTIELDNIVWGDCLEFEDRALSNGRVSETRRFVS